MGLKRELIIDEEFRDLIDPLSDAEYKQLEENCIQDGILDSIKTWNGIIIDGHNRYSIAWANDLNFEVAEMAIGEREDVISWIIDLQLGRRNLNPNRASYLRGLQYNMQKLRKGKWNRQNDDSGQTRTLLGSKYNIAPKTVEREGKYAESLDQMPEIKDAIIQGEIKSSKKDIRAFKDLEPNQKKEIVQRAKETNRFEIKNEAIPIQTLRTVQFDKNRAKIKRFATMNEVRYLKAVGENTYIVSVDERPDWHTLLKIANAHV